MPEYKNCLHFKRNGTTYEAPVYTLPTDEEVAGKAAPVPVSGQTMYMASGAPDNEFAIPVNCRLPNDSTVRNLLTYQCPTGSYTFTKTGTYTMTFTVPNGVKVLYCKTGALSGWNAYQYAYSSQQTYSKNKWEVCWFFLNDYKIYDGESYYSGSTDKSRYIGVTPGKTYTLNVVIDNLKARPVISWSKEINKHAVDFYDL